MSNNNFNESAPTWVSKEDGGSNPAYTEQSSANFNLRKNLDVELGLFDTWKKAESGLLTLDEQDREPFNRIGRPCLVSISGSDGSTENEASGLTGYWKPGSIYSSSDGDITLNGVIGADIATRWTENTNTEKYEVTIPYYYGNSIGPKGNEYFWGGHRKGLLKGSYGAGKSEAGTIIAPKVRIYYCKGCGTIAGGTAESPVYFEELTDLPKIDIRTGNIVIESNTNTLTYLVVIY